MSALPVCIIAGGTSRRFGSPKGLARLDGVSLIDQIVRAIQQQTDGPIALNAAADGPYSHYDMPLVPDLIVGDFGPLSGLHAAMTWADNSGFDSVITCPLDTPFLPSNLIKRLERKGAPAICKSNGRWHPLVGIWECRQASSLVEYLKYDDRSVHSWAKRCGADVVEFANDGIGRDPFFNINTQSDLRSCDAAHANTYGES